MGKALYRKYRPKTLAEVVGEEQVTTALENALKTNKISHAYLFIGPRGCGKTSVARIFAHAVNNFKYELEDDYVDIIEIDAASNTGVDNIRELREKACIAPSEGKYKVYIIDEVHMLSKSAFNALLKTLEEPPKHVIFIMATTDAYKVPITITSRAQTYTFKLASTEVIFEHLKKICTAEKINIEDDAIKLVAARSGGSFRDALSLLDQVSTITEEAITKDLIIKILGLPEDEKINSCLAACKNGDLAKITAELKDLLSSGVKPEVIAEEIIKAVIANPVPELLPLLSKLPSVTAPFAEAKLLVALTSNISYSTPQKTSEPVAKTSQPVAKTYSEPEKKLTEKKSDILPEKKSSEEVSKSSDQVSKTSETVEGFINNIKSQATAKFLEQSDIEIVDGTINIYPKNKFALNGLKKEQHQTIMSAATSLKIAVHAEKNTKEDPLVSKISDIMGGAEEVKNSGGKIPF